MDSFYLSVHFYVSVCVCVCVLGRWGSEHEKVNIHFQLHALLLQLYVCDVLLNRYYQTERALTKPQVWLLYTHNHTRVR